MHTIDNNSYDNIKTNCDGLFVKFGYHTSF